MKHNLLLQCMLILSVASTGQNRQITGTAFYKYNDFVGNRPDAGATVKVFSLNDPNLEKSSTVDLQGNFSVSNLDTGAHLLIIVSKETNDDPYLGYSRTVIYGKLFNKYFGFNPQTIDTALQNAIEAKHQEYMEYGVSKKFSYKKVMNTKKEVMEMVFKFFNELPIEKMIRTGINLPTDKYDIKELTLNEKPLDKLVIDFGISNH
jgi:hypothetical protein